MHRYSAIMVHAYSLVTGKGLERDISELQFTDVLNLKEVTNLSRDETDYLNGMLNNREIVASWKRAFG